MSRDGWTDRTRWMDGWMEGCSRLLRPVKADDMSEMNKRRK